MAGQSYSFNIKSGVASIVSIPTFLSDGTGLTAAMTKDGTELAVVLASGNIQLTIPSAIATTSNNGESYTVSKGGKVIVRGEIYVIDKPSAPVVSGAGNLILVSDNTGTTARPEGVVAWIVPNGVTPSNAQPTDLVFTVANTSTPTVEYSIFGASSYGGRTVTYNTDGTPSIKLAQSFYYVGTPTKRLTGGRLYVPAGTTGVNGASVTFSWYITPYNTLVDLSSAPLESKTVSVTPGGWTEARLNTPRALNATDRAWVVYTFGDGRYLSSGDLGSSAIQSLASSNIYIASANEGGVARSAFRIGSGSTSPQAGGSYAIDAIFDGGA